MRSMELIHILSDVESDMVTVKLSGKHYKIKEVHHYESKLVPGQEVAEIVIEEYD